MHSQAKLTRRIFAAVATSTLLAAFLAFTSQSATAQPKSAPTYKVVVDVAQSGDAFPRAIGSVHNLLKALGPDHVEVEVVAHSAGINLLVAAANSYTAELTELSKEGVHFAACENSMRANHLTKADLLPFAVPVDSGVAELVRRQHEGYVYLYIPN
ncbi:MAG: DsrE family protein [Acidobacteriaceae bacterium]